MSKNPDFESKHPRTDGGKFAEKPEVSTGVSLAGAQHHPIIDPAKAASERMFDNLHAFETCDALVYISKYAALMPDGVDEVTVEYDDENGAYVKMASPIPVGRDYLDVRDDLDEALGDAGLGWATFRDANGLQYENSGVYTVRREEAGLLAERQQAKVDAMDRLAANLAPGTKIVREPLTTEQMLKLTDKNGDLTVVTPVDPSQLYRVIAADDGYEHNDGATRELFSELVDGSDPEEMGGDSYGYEGHRVVGVSPVSGDMLVEVQLLRA